LYRVETASLRVRQPDYFENLLKTTVLRYFDSKVYGKVKKEEEKAKPIISKMIKKVLKK